MPIAMRMVIDDRRILGNMEDISTFNKYNYTYSHKHSDADKPVLLCKKSLQARRDFGLKPRDNDDPKQFNFSNVDYDKNDINFTIYGDSRFGFHNSLHIGHECLLYV